MFLPFDIRKLQRGTFGQADLQIAGTKFFLTGIHFECSPISPLLNDNGFDIQNAADVEQFRNEIAIGERIVMLPPLTDDDFA